MNISEKALEELTNAARCVLFGANPCEQGFSKIANWRVNMLGNALQAIEIEKQSKEEL